MNNSWHVLLIFNHNTKKNENLICHPRSDEILRERRKNISPRYCLFKELTTTTDLNLLAGPLSGRGFGRVEQRSPAPVPLLMVVGRRRQEVHILLGDAAAAPTLHLAQRPVLPLGPAIETASDKEGVADPEPDWIRISIRSVDPDPGGQK